MLSVRPEVLERASPKLLQRMGFQATTGAQTNEGHGFGARGLVGERAGAILSAPRFALASPDPKTGFDTWSDRGKVRVRLEPHADGWESALRDRGHTVEMATVSEMSGFGHAHLIEVTPGGALAGAADPRAYASAAVGR